MSNDFELTLYASGTKIVDEFGIEARAAFVPAGKLFFVEEAKKDELSWPGSMHLEPVSFHPGPPLNETLPTKFPEGGNELCIIGLMSTEDGPRPLDIAIQKVRILELKNGEKVRIIRVSPDPRGLLIKATPF